MKKLLLISFILFFIQPFKSSGQFQIVGNASTTTPQCPSAVTTYLLTPNLGNQGGEIWYTTKVNLTQNFDIQFQMFLGTKAYSAGADGICFAFQQQSTSAGSIGGGLGYGGITPSIAVEFDTYQNGWDPPFCHTAIEQNGDVDHTTPNTLAGPVQLDPVNPNLPDGNWHNMEITWNPTSKTLNVYYDCNLRISYTGDIVTNIFGGNPNVYWGFTAGTGGAENTQEVCITHSYLNNLRDTLICAGASVPLNSSGGVTYSWAPAAGLSATTGASVNASPTTTTTYTVSITNSCGLVSKDSAVIRVSNTVLTPTSTTATCGNNNGSVSVTATGGITTYNYTWSGGQTTTTVNNLGAGTYTINTTDSLGCPATATVTITGTPALRDSIVSFTNVSVACGSNGTAVDGVKGGLGPYSYSWTTVPIQTTANANNLPAATYTCTVTDANSCTATATVTIAQPGALTASISATTNVSCNGGNNGSATGSITGGTGPYTYSWNTGPVQTNQTATGLMAGTYTVSVTDANGCTVPAVAVITQPAAIRDSIASFTNVLCNGQSNGTATDGVKGGTGPYSYAWCNAQTSSVATALPAGSCTVTVTDANLCAATATVTITQPTPLQLTASAFPATCNGTCTGSATVIPSGGTTPYTYNWSNATSTANANNLCAANYSVVVTDGNGCVHDTNPLTVTQPPAIRDSVVASANELCFGQTNGSITSGVVGGTGAYTYSWNSTPVQTTPGATNLPAGNYTLIIKDANGCEDSLKQTITQPALLTLTGPAPISICNGQSAFIQPVTNGGTTAYTYQWNTGPTTDTMTVNPVTSTTYTLVVTDANGCTAQATATVNVALPLSVTAPVSTAICPGNSATLTATAKGGDGTYTYIWTPGPLNGQSVKVSPLVTSTYTVTVTDGCGTPSVTTTMAVIVDPLPIVSFTQDTINGCYPVCVTFTDKSTIASGGIKTWGWNFGNGSISGMQNPMNCYTNPGMYTVSLTVTSDSGCSSAVVENNLITVYDHPHTDFTSSPQPTSIALPNITFTDETTDPYGLVQWLWNLGDTSSAANLAITQNTTHSYADTGTYCVKLIDMNKHGCIDSMTHCIVIDPLFTFYIPNAFTPNGDGVNDVFAPKGGYFKTFDMYIFDRWGSTLYHTLDINKGWNGGFNNNNNICQTDTYVYVINITDWKGVSHTYMGRVSLVK
ncbi:MAG TPA: PKD domain-containing protein [Bacteroidia bacterium]|nr:PKD domain-containing protein [Bacteroidia bacterium]